jgi:hypothetical protein
MAAEDDERGRIETIDQHRSLLVMTCYDHPSEVIRQGGLGPCAARFLVNETVSARHFSEGACAPFRARVLSIWGPGGPRTIVKQIARCGVCGRPLGGLGCETKEHRTDPRLTQEVRMNGVRRNADHAGFAPTNGLGKRPVRA